MNPIKKITAVFLTAVMILSGCASGRRTQKEEASFSSAETKAGEKIHAEILSSFYIYTEPNAAEYVKQVGDKIAAHAKRRDLKYRFTILYSDKIYATSAPGGYLYVTTAMMNYLENEAELAAIFAHEIARLQEKDLRFQRGWRMLQRAAEGGAVVASAFGQVGALAALALILIHSTAESRGISAEDQLYQADQKALQYLVEADYDPQGMLDLFYKFSNVEEPLLPYFYDYFQSRPLTVDRLRHFENEFGDLSLSGKTLSVRREAYQEMTRGIRQIYRS